MAEKYVEHAEANEQINVIANLLAQRHSDKAIADQLIARGMRNLASSDGVWTEDDVCRIRIDFALAPIRRADVERVLLTTEAFVSFPIKKRLEIVSAETAFGMNLF